MTRAVQVACVIGLAVFWAVNWPMMKIGLQVIEPWTFRALLVVVGGLGTLAVAAALGQSLRISRADLVPLLWLTLFQGVLWNAFSGFGIAWIEAGRAAVLGFTMPVWATLLAMLFLGEAVTRRRLFGLALGMGGMALLLLPALGQMGQSLAGALFMVVGAVCWGVATVIVRGTDWDMGTLALSGWQFSLGAVPLVIAAVVLGEPASLLRVDAATGAAVAFSALIPMIFCQAVWYTIVRRLPAALSSTGTLLVPPLGVAFSAAILGERFGAFELLAMLLVALAMLLVLPGFGWRAVLGRRGA